MTDDTLTRTQYLKIPEVAEDLRVSTRTVHRLIDAGTLEAHVLGPRTIRIPVTSYRAYKAGLEAAAVQRAAERSAGYIPGQLEVAPF